MKKKILLIFVFLVLTSFVLAFDTDFLETFTAGNQALNGYNGWHCSEDSADTKILDNQAVIPRTGGYDDTCEHNVTNSGNFDVSSNDISFSLNLIAYTEGVNFGICGTVSAGTNLCGGIIGSFNNCGSDGYFIMADPLHNDFTIRRCIGNVGSDIHPETGSTINAGDKLEIRVIDNGTQWVEYWRNSVFVAAVADSTWTQFYSGGVIALKVVTVDNVNLSYRSRAPADSCTYSSGDWNVDCSDNCIITAVTHLENNDLILEGTGSFTVSADITVDSVSVPKGGGCNLIIEKNSGNELIIKKG